MLTVQLTTPHATNELIDTLMTEFYNQTTQIFSFSSKFLPFLSSFSFSFFSLFFLFLFLSSFNSSPPPPTPPSLQYLHFFNTFILLSYFGLLFSAPGGRAGVKTCPRLKHSRHTSTSSPSFHLLHTPIHLIPTNKLSLFGCVDECTRGFGRECFVREKKGDALEGGEKGTPPNSPHPHVPVPLSVLVRIKKFCFLPLFLCAKQRFRRFFLNTY